MARFSLFVLATFLAPAFAFVPHVPPPAPQKSSPSPIEAGLKTLENLPVLLPALLGAVIGASPVLADGAFSAGTAYRAQGIYAPRITALKTAVDSGDISKVKAEEPAFVLYTSQRFATDKVKQKQVQAAYSKLAKAIENQDVSALKSSYDEYYTAAELGKSSGFTSKDRGVVVGSDYHFAVKNPNY